MILVIVISCETQAENIRKQCFLSTYLLVTYCHNYILILFPCCAFKRLVFMYVKHTYTFVSMVIEREREKQMDAVDACWYSIAVFFCRITWRNFTKFCSAPAAPFAEARRSSRGCERISMDFSTDWHCGTFWWMNGKSWRFFSRLLALCLDSGQRSEWTNQSRNPPAPKVPRRFLCAHMIRK